MSGDGLVYTILLFLLVAVVLHFLLRRRRASASTEAASKGRETSSLQAVHRLKTEGGLDAKDVASTTSPASATLLSVPVLSGIVPASRVSQNKEKDIGLRWKRLSESKQWSQERKQFIQSREGTLRASYKRWELPDDVPKNVLDTAAEEAYALGKRFGRTPQEIQDLGDEARRTLENELAGMHLDREDRGGCVIS